MNQTNNVGLTVVPLEDTVLAIVVEIPFLFLCSITVLVAAYYDLVKQKTLLSKKTLQNSMFWLYSLYIIAIAVTVIRIPVRSLPGNPVPPELITIIYNWATSLMVAVSSILPWRFYEAYRKLARLNVDALRTVIFFLLIWVVLLVVTIVILAVDWKTLESVLLVWRIMFTLAAICEIILLGLVTWIVGREKFKSAKSLRWYVYTTIVMRVIIVVTVILKYVGVVDVFILKTIHMITIICGIMTYAWNTRNRERERERRDSRMSSREGPRSKRGSSSLSFEKDNKNPHRKDKSRESDNTTVESDIAESVEKPVKTTPSNYAIVEKR
jgi:hypothetical protein